jgi:transposase
VVPVELLLAAQAQIAALLEQIAALTAQLSAAQAEARDERAKLHLTIDGLVAKIDELMGKKKGKAKAAPPAPAPEPRPVPAELADRPLPPAKPEPEETPKKARQRRAKPPLRQAPPEAVRPDRCGRCGGTHLLAKDTTTRELVDWVAGYVQERVIALTRCRCVDCGKVTTPVVPGACLPKTRFTAAFVAHLLHGKYTLHLALERLRGELARQGYPMASATISDVVQRALGELRGVARVVWKAVQAFPYAHSDATGLPVVLDDKDSTHLGQMFFFGWGKLAAFRYSSDKEGASFTRMLGPFKGTLVLDASSTHNDALADGTIRWAGCNAHGLRKFREAKESDPVLGAEGERWIASWFDKEREARDLGLIGDDLLQWRQQHIAPLVAGFKDWLKRVHPTVLPKSPLAEATRYYANYWRPLTAFLRDPNLPLENNFAERNLRATALGRSNWLFANGHESAENTAVAYTLVQTAKLHGLDVQAYLTWALERVAACERPDDYAALTPMAYEEAQKRAGD